MASTISAGTTTTTALVYSADTSGVLQLQTNGGTTAVTIDTNQNVGVGVTPSANWNSAVKAVQVNGSALACNNGTTGLLSGLTWDSSYNYKYSINNVAGAIVFNTTGGGGWAFLNAPSGTAGNTATVTQAMTLDASGNLLVGVTAYNYSSTADAFQIGAGANASVISRSTTAVRQLFIFNNPNGGVGAINISGSSTSFITSSDYRLKENIAPMTGALAIVAQLKPVTYNWKVDGSNGQGFIAHELAELVPDCVTGEKDAVDANGNPQYQGIDTSFLVATLTAAIQELAAQVTTLQTQVTTLKG
jgi:hypothetical protein